MHAGMKRRNGTASCGPFGPVSRSAAGGTTGNAGRLLTGLRQDTRARIELPRAIDATVALRGARGGATAWPVGYDNCQAAILKTSVRRPLMPSTAAGSKPQWTMQCSQRGSLPLAQLVPIGQLDQIAIGLVVRVGDQIAGAFPAAQVAGRIGPGGAAQVPFAAEELQVYRRGVQAKAGQQFFGLAKFLMHVVAGHENLGSSRGIRALHGRVAIGRREHEAIDPQFREKGEQTAISFMSVSL